MRGAQRECEAPVKLWVHWLYWYHLWVRRREMPSSMVFLAFLFSSGPVQETLPLVWSIPGHKPPMAERRWSCKELAPLLIYLSSAWRAPVQNRLSCSLPFVWFMR